MSVELYFNNASSFDDRGLEALFSMEAIAQVFLDVERVVAQAQGEIGLIPEESANVICENCRFELIDQDRLRAGHETTRHPLMPLINELVRLSGPIHGGYVHWGITTQNVIQTGLMRQAQQAQQIIETFLRDILHHLGRLATEHSSTPMAGRTHFRHAVPITLGYKIAVWIEELLQAIDRLREAGQRSFAAMSGGAVGCFSALGEVGPTFQARVAVLLGMGEMAVPSRAIRTQISEWVNALALAASVCHRIAEEVYQSSSEEYGEIFEQRSAGAIGSSTMPQKINPYFCYGIIENANRLYAHAGLMLAQAHRPFESDGSTNLLYENGVCAAVEMISKVLVRTEAMTCNLQVDAVRMRENLKLSKGAIYSEFAMMELGRAIGKHRGHEMVHDIAVKAADGGVPFLDALSGLPGGEELREEILSRIEKGEVGGLCSEYAQHYGALASTLDLDALPDTDQRSAAAVLKEGTVQ